MNKQKWTEKPVTWGGYLKLSGIVTVIGAIFSAVYIIAMFEPACGSGFGRRLERRSTIGPGKGIVSKGREPLQQAAPFLFLSTEVVFTKTGLRP